MRLDRTGLIDNAVGGIRDQVGFDEVVEVGRDAVDRKILPSGSALLDGVSHVQSFLKGP